MDWITIRTPQAVLISLCLQSMVDELLDRQQRGDRGGSTDREEDDGVRAAAATTTTTATGRISRWLESKFSRRGCDEYGGDAASLRNALVQNAVFHDIGDDDL